MNVAWRNVLESECYKRECLWLYKKWERNVVRRLYEWKRIVKIYESESERGVTRVAEKASFFLIIWLCERRENNTTTVWLCVCKT